MAAALRLIVAFQQPPVLVGDAEEYAAIGRHLRFDHQFSFGAVRRWGHPPIDDPAGHLEPTAFRAPLLPAAIAALWWTPRDRPPVRAIQVMNALAGGLTVVFTFLVAERFARGWLPIAAAGIVAVFPLAVESDAAPLSEALFTMLLMAGLLCWLRQRMTVAGALFGLASLTRVTLLPVLAVLTVAGVVPAFRKYRLLPMVAAAWLVIAPWTIRNALVTHRFVPVAIAGSGTNLLFGTIWVRPFGGRDLYSTYLADADVRAILAEAPDDATAEQRMQPVAIRRILAAPARWVFVRLAQFPRLLITASAGSPAAKLGAVAGDIALMVLAAVGIYRRRGSWQGEWVLITLILMLLVYFPIMAEHRLAAPLVPLLAVYAGLAVTSRTGADSTRLAGRTA